ncbi:nitrilase family protein [Pedobacter riviphilus]|uniref:Nitrilase family protein n=1 Tax=Pedobacter riviphilus TaxID=2766984 RepID=A0ABX6TBN2_9SPHI|nr:nitrilase family protein [Pedobacter riviphilus]QNR82906.1 nitrilase family protein [Pedobacter riviphilus]
MKKIKIATAQFENRSGDKEYNLKMIEQLAEQAAKAGADVISFHECSITGYTFARHLSYAQMLALSERIPNGPSVAALVGFAKKYGIVILAGLFEKDENDEIYKAYVCVDGNGLIASHRKLHPFINPYIKPGAAYTVFELLGWKCGILICYDNNIIENVRATRLLGAQVIFMPHVTMCTPSSRPGAGFVDASLWKDKNANARLLKEEFNGDKGRKWLMKWLPARAYDNAVYAVFSNPIGMDDDQLKNGCSMILDPFGEVIAECTSLDDETAIAELDPQKLTDAGGSRYIMARKPALYAAIIGKNHKSEHKVSWLK